MQARQAVILYRQSEYRICGKTNTDKQSLSLEGKAASEASRIGQWRYEREREIVSSRRYTSTRAPLRGSLSPMGKATIREDRYSHIIRANTGYVEKKNNDGQSLPRVGKVASGASRIGFWRHEKQVGKIVSSAPLTRAPYPPLARSPFPDGEGCDTRIPLFSTQRLSQWGRQRGGGFAAEKGSKPRLAALGSPFQGKGLAWILPPSYGRRCPEGAEVGWGKRYEREGESSQVDDSRKPPLQENNL